MVFCYECHEELLHNPVILPLDIQRFAALVIHAGLNEPQKPDHKRLLAGRVQLMQKVISAGLLALESSSLATE